MGFTSISGLKGNLLFTVVILLCLCSNLKLCFGMDTITSTHFIKGQETLISSSGAFKLGFFSPNNSTNIYLGVLYNLSVTTFVWVANREIPLRDYTNSFTISQDGNLVILDRRNQTVWSTNHSDTVTNPTAQLLDTGNFVIRDDSNGRSIWESFHNPTGSFIPKMKMKDRRNRSSDNLLNSWKTLSDPSAGDFFAGLDMTYVAEIFVWRQSVPYWRSGPWNGLLFLGIPDINRVYTNAFNLVNDNEGNVYFTYVCSNGTSFTYFLLNYDGNLLQRNWFPSSNSWRTTWDAIRSDCDVYGKCGLNGVCTTKTSPICSCLRGFIPRNPNEWSTGNWTSGCVRETELLCERNTSVNNGGNGKRDGFVKLTNMKVPAFAVWSNAPEVNCGRDCLENCSCIARAFHSGIGCMHWYDHMIDVQKFTDGVGVDLYIRLADSELDKKKNKNLVIVIVGIVVLIAVAICAFLTWKYMVRKKGIKKGELSHFSSDSLCKGNAKLEELPLYDFEILKAATENFDVVNKLGEGGFGPVYKGKLFDGQEIAVKRLSRSSGQGLQEFMNEIVVISKLQHRNLVKLLGCCIDGDEKMLVYEYMPNKSLDALLFEPQNEVLLDWSRRANIIEGIGRGLLYLHRDSRLRIIHRDLKASNILLDEDLTPKISDFGMARIFGGEQDQADTIRVVGTYGYMAPEYAMQGRFSEKSDVFSFGVLVLEIISGRRNTSFYNDEHYLSLIGRAWDLSKENKIIELIDPTVFDSTYQKEIIRFINMGLLCVQEFASDRPTMSTILLMLSNEISELGIPKQPAFTHEKLSAPKTDSSTSYKNLSVTC